MQRIADVSEALRGMPVPALVALVILSGFALAAWAIYAVMSVSKGKKNVD